MSPRRKPLKTQKAVIAWLADAKTSTNTNTLSHINEEVIAKVRKCFARANHENANEAESRAAFKMASKIMDQHKISQADLMQAEDKEARDRRGGMSTVAIWPAKLTEAECASGKEGRAFMQGWVSWLVGAMEKFFDCRAYSTQLKREVEWTFYGIAIHTVSAAIAFEAIHNQIQDWSGKHKGVSTRNSYCLGVSNGLHTLANEEKRAIEERIRANEAKGLAARMKEEDIKRQAELARLRVSPTPEVTDNIAIDGDAGDGTDAGGFDDDDGCDDDNGMPGLTGPEPENEIQADYTEDQDKPAVKDDAAADFETEFQKYLVPEETIKAQKASLPSFEEYVDEDIALPSTEPGEDHLPELEETSEWKSMRQLTVFREMSRDIEDSVLAEHKVKLRKARKGKTSIKDRAAYKEGKKDSRKIEVRAARIEEGKYDGVLAGKRPVSSMDALPIRKKKRVSPPMDLDVS